MSSALFATIVSTISLSLVDGATSDVMTSTIPGIPGCSRSPYSARLFLPFILVFVFQLGLVCLTIIRVIQSGRSAKSPLYIVLVKHNIFYYACGLCESGISVLISDDYRFKSFVGRERHSANACGYVFRILLPRTVFILAILATRMHLHLWYTKRHVHGSEALVCISVSDMLHVDCTA
ncbi:hypothetical protein DFJ58DRAFT_749612 [Suillus subalutaceus]|uniref:uncharacterized protein n=1 Tax=Suillus subalutaceus TaxID=48586 RepID=UPI001B870B6E|nr:uncharacterized protein DFJ58DRAFT_749612 [Suillus subalutaceus]KAG1836968.1 hypothetical protein DFJ58DRAFT_749612 [Suillus subalutaceus]